MVFLRFLLIGLIAGWILGRITRGHGFGLLGNIVIGMLGSIAGGFLFGLLGLSVNGLIGSIVMSIVGAIAFFVLLDTVLPFHRHSKESSGD